MPTVAGMERRQRREPMFSSARMWFRGGRAAGLPASGGDAAEPVPPPSAVRLLPLSGDEPAANWTSQCEVAPGLPGNARAHAHARHGRFLAKPIGQTMTTTLEERGSIDTASLGTPIRASRRREAPASPTPPFALGSGASCAMMTRFGAGNWNAAMAGPCFEPHTSARYEPGDAPRGRATCPATTRAR